MLRIKLCSPRIRSDISNDDVDTILINRTQLETAFGYTFNDRAYLLQALTHPSYPRNRVTGTYQFRISRRCRTRFFIYRIYNGAMCTHGSR